VWVHDVGGGDRFEWPTKKGYLTSGQITDLRVSPRGDLVAFLEHPIPDDPRGFVLVADGDGNKKASSEEFLNVDGLAWSYRRDEVWFTAAKKGQRRALYALDLSGHERQIWEGAASLSLQDISPDGRVLVEVGSERELIRGLLNGEAKERDLSWLDYSVAEDLSPDGRMLLLDELGDGGGPLHSVYLRQAGNVSPIRLCDGIGAALSPDGRWAVSILDSPTSRLTIVPIFGGGSREMPRGHLARFVSATWFPDGKRLAEAGIDEGGHQRCYVQSIAGGDPTPVTPEGTYGCMVSPDSKYILASADRGKRTALYPYPVGRGAPIAVRGVGHDDEVIRFSMDGRSLFISKERAGDGETDIFKLEIVTGKRDRWKTIRTPDPAVEKLSSILLTPDGKSYVYQYDVTISDLYIVDGLK
jgi:Tol biopolymer transport system component